AGIDPMPLVSEAVRGEGAIVVTEQGEPVSENSLAARDVVSRAEWAALMAGHKVFLDARNAPGAHFPRLFPAITKKINDAGLDPRTDLIPIHPAAHYHMGGVQVDARQETNIRGLYAVGEVCSTGLHGANRLASNSLLEAVVTGRETGVYLRTLAGKTSDQESHQATMITRRAIESPELPLAKIREVITAAAGVLRDQDGLEQAKELLLPALDTDAGLVAYLIAASAALRMESRGAHTRTDFPNTNAKAEHITVHISDFTELSTQ
ncbi:MAG: FAD-binding protein, partial [Propionibacteriaceae bacterium]|nr:FAD-binding protein [Propionibacteriaceae bacterium]